MGVQRFCDDNNDSDSDSNYSVICLKRRSFQY